MAASVHPDDWMNTASLLVRASELWLLATDHERALSAIRRAVDTGEHVIPDARCYLVDALVGAGQLQEADAIATELKRSRGSDLNIYEFLGDSYHAHGHLQHAHRWYTMGVVRASPARIDFDEDGFLRLLTGRCRVRRELGMPPDDYDYLFMERIFDGFEASGGHVDAVLAAMERTSGPLDAFRK